MSLASKSSPGDPRWPMPLSSTQPARRMDQSSLCPCARATELPTVLRTVQRLRRAPKTKNRGACVATFFENFTILRV